VEKIRFVVLGLICIPILGLGKGLDENSIRVRVLSSQTRLSFSDLKIKLEMGNENLRPVSESVASWSIQISKVSGVPMWQVEKKNPVSKIFLYEARKPLTFSTENGSKIRVIQNQGSRFDVISVLPLKDYLRGVLAGEMPKNWPLEALKAQTVAARSYALRLMIERSERNFDVESDHRDQVFKMNESTSNGPMTTAKKAVTETENLVLMDGHQPMKAFYHSDCGGESASARSVWGGESTGEDQNTNLISSSCPLKGRTSWDFQISEESLIKKLKVRWPALKFSEITSLQWRSEPNRERISEIQINLKKAKPVKISSQDFRQILGFQNLKSTLFQVEKNGNRWAFKG